MKPYTQKNLSAEEVILETDESATQRENRPATSSETMGTEPSRTNSSGRRKYRDYSNANCRTIDSNRKNKQNSFIRLTTTGGHSDVSQQSREYNDTTPPYPSSTRPPSLPCTIPLYVTVIYNRTINIRSITTGHRNFSRTTGNSNE